MTVRRSTHTGQSLPSSAGLMSNLFFNEVADATKESSRSMH